MTVRATIEHLLDNMQEAEVAAQERTMTFSIRMSESDHETLTYLANYFHMKKTPFVDMLLRDAMHETMQTIALHRAGGNEDRAREIYFELLSQVGAEGHSRNGQGVS